jgi:hypothetical protein
VKLGIQSAAGMERLWAEARVTLLKWSETLKEKTWGPPMGSMRERG